MADFNLDTFKKVALWSSMPETFLAGGLEETLFEERFPGCVLPCWGEDGIRWYAIAMDQTEWRALQPILTAYAGHTVTTFNGEPADLTAENEVEAFLITQNPHAVARLIPSKNVAFAARALVRMRDTLLARPVDLRPTQISTAAMISHFDMCLVEGDRDGAKHWLSRMKDEFRLDSLNISFTRVKFYAHFREWKKILSDPTFPELCRVTKPLIIAHHLLEALWFTFMSGHPEGEPSRQSTFDKHCKDFAEDIFASSGMPSRWAADAFKEFWPGEGPAKQGVPPADEKAEEETSSSDQPPDLQTGWLEWINALNDKEFRFRERAEDLVLNDDASSIHDPEDVGEIEEALFELSSKRELERLEQALPQIITWLKQDDGYPRKLMSPIYEIVLLRLIETQNRDGEFREGISEMFTALLEVGLSGEQYKSLLQGVSDSIPDGAGTSDAYWLIDIAEVLCRFSAPIEAARNTLLNQILGSLKPIANQLSSLQHSAYSSVAKTAGWEPLPDEESDEKETTADLLRGKLVGIYTLTESAGRQAKAALLRIAPDVKVEVSSDKVCTPRLTKLSQNADFMIITTSSAKHAATDCIRAQRDAEHILYAAGRGCCSILRSIEENLACLA